MTELTKGEIFELLEALNRIEKGIYVIAKETRQEKNKKNVELFIEILNDVKTTVDKEGKILGGMMMDKILDGEGK